MVQLIAGQYIIQDLQADLLGQGGMGQVYRGREVQTGAPVAIKLLKTEVVEPEMIERFNREGEILRRLNHPNIVKLLATAEEAGRHYLVMEYVGGGSLQELLEQQGPLPVARVLDFALDLADALTRAHRLEIIHRDLKPANVLLAEDGSPRLTDFGIARALNSPSLTQTGLVLGTINYLSPEGCNGQKLDTRSDIWAFGVLLYELLTGQQPFRGETWVATMMAIMSQPTPDLNQQRPDVPEALARLIYRMLEKDPQHRLPSVRLVGAELEAIKQGWAVEEQRHKLGQPSTSQAISTPLLAVISGPRHNLPTFSTPLVGREAELAELARLLATPEARLITLLGPGGMGKTRLSVAAAAGQVETMAQGVAFVPLAPVNPADFTGELNPLIATLAEALKFTLQAGGDPSRQLLTHLQEKEILLVLDNFEHFLANSHFPVMADFLSQLLSQAPGVKILVTSRERLNLQEEWLFPLQGLAFPRKTTEVLKTSVVSPETSEVESSYGAIQLFGQRARQVQPHFDLAAEQPWIEQICQLVEGLPLGIELAATWVRLMSCQAIVQELEKGLDVLTSQLRNVPERQRSMRTVFEQSWSLLSAAEREVMRKLSIFRGGFQRAAAEAVAGASLVSLSALVDKSLVRVTPSGRYELHELLRQYAAERLGLRAEEEELTQTRHGRYYLAFLTDQEQHLKGPKLKEAKVALTTDIDNLRLAYHWAVEGEHITDIAPAMESLWLFYEIQGWLLEGEEAFARVVAKARSFGNPPPATEETSLTESGLILGRVLGYQGYFQAHLGLSQATASCQESLAILRSAGPNTRRETALTLSFLSETVGWLEGKYREAASLLQEGFELFKEAGDPWGAGFMLMNLGQHLHDLGEQAEAERVIQESIAYFNKIGEQQHIVYSINTLGNIAATQGQYPLAEAILLECLQRRSDLGDRPGLVLTLRNLGWVVMHQGKHTQAKQYFEQGVALGKEIGLSLATSHSLCGLGWLAIKQGDYIEAKWRFQEASAVGKGTSAGLWGLDGLGWAALRLEEYNEAEKYFHDVLEVSITSQDWSLTLNSLTGLAYLLTRKGELERALEFLTLISSHHASFQPMKNLAKPLQAKLATGLPPEVVTAAQSRGQALELEATAREMLAELEGDQENP